MSTKRVVDDPYMPREDSELLAEVVSLRARGRVLDMGTGSGIQAKAASLKADSVLGVDVNLKAIKYAEENNSAENIEYRLSDLFSEIKGKFDVIIFNAPYLPDDPEIADIALDGGKEGFEVIERFLVTVKDHLSEKGEILLLFSSHSKLEVVEGIIAKLGLVSEKVAEKKLFFEMLYVYSISRPSV